MERTGFAAVVPCRYHLCVKYRVTHTYIHTYIHTYMFVVVNFDALAQASDIRIERRQVVFLCWEQDSNPSGSQTPNRQQTECPLTNRLSYRGSSYKTCTRQPVPMISEHSAHLTPQPFGIRTWLWRYTCLLLLISMLWHRQTIFESKGDKLSSSAESRIRTHQGLRHQIASRLNTHCKIIQRFISGKDCNSFCLICDMHKIDNFIYDHRKDELLMFYLVTCVNQQTLNSCYIHITRKFDLRWYIHEHNIWETWGFNVRANFDNVSRVDMVVANVIMHFLSIWPGLYSLGRRTS